MQHAESSQIMVFLSSQIMTPNHALQRTRRPAGQSDGLGNLFATVAADRALSVPNAATKMFPTPLTLRSAHRGPVAVAELGSLGISL
jgi:hypothetical protein